MNRIVPAVVVLAALAGAAPAQGYRTYTSGKHGFKLKVPRWLEEQPLEPLEEQILVKWSGRHKGRWKGRTHKNLELTLVVARIRKARAPTTEREPAKERTKSLRQQERERLNGGTTIEEFLKRREWVSQKRWRPELTRPVKSKLGRDFDIYEVSSNRDDSLAIRAFTVEDDAEIFGLFAIGVGANEAFERQILRTAMTLERIPIESADSRGGEATSAVYAGSELRGIAHREKVRRRLVEGWDAYDTENFILVTNIKHKRMIDSILTDLEIMRKEYMKHFPPLEEMDQVSTVRVCASYEDYRRYGAPQGSGGYWNHIDEELVLFHPGRRIPKARAWLKKIDPLAIMYHEAMHQYLHYANGRVPPASWFNEGYGEYFGGAVVDRRRGEIRRIEKNKFRMAWVKQMQRLDQWPDLRYVMAITQSEFYAESSLQNYAMGWAICYFLEQEREKKPDERNEKWAAIPESYLKNLRAATRKKLEKMPKDAPKDWISGFETEIQNQAFEKTFAGWTDEDWIELENAWHDAMRRW